MSEELEVKNEEVVVVEVNPVEAAASDMGWMPKEQWTEAGKDPAKWRSAELFVELEPLFGKIESLKKEVRSGKQTLETFKQHYSKVRETEYRRALDELKVQKRMALEEGDAASVVEIDEEIAQTKSNALRAQQEQMQSAAQEIHPEFADWVSENPWYASNREMQTFADSFGRAYAASHTGASPKEVLREVEKRVKQAYPDKFKNPAQDRKSGVEAPRQSTKKIEARFELSEDERRVMNKLVKGGHITEEKYMADLKTVKGL